MKINVNGTEYHVKYKTNRNGKRTLVIYDYYPAEEIEQEDTGGDMKDYLLNLYKEIEEKTEEASNEFMEDRKNRAKRAGFSWMMAQNDLMEKILDDLDIEIQEVEDES